MESVTNSILVKQNPCLTTLQMWTFLVTPWFGLTFNTLISLLFADQISFAPDDTNPFGSALILSSLHGQIPSASLWSNHTIFHLLPKVVQILSSATLVLFPLLNPNWSSPSTSSIFISFVLRSTLANVFAVCAMGQIVRGLLHFLAFAFFFAVLILTSVKYLRHSLVSYMVWLAVSLVWGHLDVMSNIHPNSEISSLSSRLHRPIKRGVPAHVKIWKKTKSEERKTPLTINPFECSYVDFIIIISNL